MYYPVLSRLKWNPCVNQCPPFHQHSHLPSPINLSNTTVSIDQAHPTTHFVSPSAPLTHSQKLKVTELNTPTISTPNTHPPGNTFYPSATRSLHTLLTVLSANSLCYLLPLIPCHLIVQPSLFHVPCFTCSHSSPATLGTIPSGTWYKRPIPTSTWSQAWIPRPLPQSHWPTHPHKMPPLFYPTICFSPIPSSLSNSPPNLILPFLF